MNQTSILQASNNDVSIRIEDHQSQRIQQQQQQQQSFQNTSNQQSQNNQRKYQTTGVTKNNTLKSHSFFGGAQSASISRNPAVNTNMNNMSSNLQAVMNNNGSSQYKVNLRDDTAAAFDMRTTAATMTAATKTDLRYLKLVIFIVTQLIEKFFFFTLFIFSLPLQALQIIIGVIYGIASAIKYFIFLYIYNLNISLPATSKNESEDESQQSVKLRFCNQCQGKVNVDCVHCEICKKCVFRRLFHTSVIGRCVNHRNLLPIKVVVGINLGEGIAEVVIALLTVREILINEDSFKTLIIRIYRDSSGKALIGLTLVVLGIIVFVLIANVFFGYSLWKASQTTKKEHKNSTPKEIPTQKIGAENMRGSVSPDAHGGQKIGAITSTLRQHSQLQNFPSSQFAQNGSIFGGNRDKRKFESHWKISPPEAKADEQAELASMNSFGTIFNFIQKKMVSCENIDKQFPNSPSKSVKSLSAMDQSVFRHRQKSSNFSEIEVGLKHSPDKGDTFNNNNPLSIVMPVSSQYNKKRGTLKSNGTKKSQQNLHRSIIHMRENETAPNRKKSEDSLKGIPGLSSLQPIN